MIKESSYNLESVSLGDFQSELKRLLIVAAKTCKELGIDYWIDSGTLLGAQRHRGFIPWDDDLDISLMKKDFDILIDRIDNSDFEKQNSCSLYYGKSNSSYWSDYLASKHYVFKNYRGELIPGHIDIFPFKALSDSDLGADRTVTNTVMYYIAGKIKFPEMFDHSLIQADRAIQLMAKRNCMREFNEQHLPKLGFIKTNTKYLTYSFEDFPYDYQRPLFLKEDIFPLKTVLFEDISVSAPNDIITFLNKLYGDFTKLPPQAKRRPFGIKFYKVSSEHAEEIKQRYIERQFENFYDRRRLLVVAQRATTTLVNSGVYTLKNKILDYFRF